MSKTLPHETSPVEVILRIEGNLRNPNVGRVVSTVLKDGPRAYRVATLYQIINPSTTSTCPYQKLRRHGKSLRGRDY